MKTLTREDFLKKYGEAGLSIVSEIKKSPNLLERTKESATQGIAKVKSAFQESQQGKNPISTGSKLGAGVIETLFSPVTATVDPILKPTLGKATELASNKLADLYGENVQAGLAEMGKTKAEDVLETTGDLATIAGTVAGARPTSRAISGAKNFTKGSIDTFDFLSEEVAKAAQSQAESQPAKIMQRVARISKGKQANFEKMAGESVGKFLTTRGIYGNIDEISTQLYDRFTRSKNIADEAIARLPGNYDPAPVKTALKELLDREIRVSSEGAPSPILGRVASLYKKLNEGGLDMSEINEAKRLYERTIKLDYLKQNLPESVARANNIDDAIRRWQFGQAKTLGLKNLDKINKETRLSKQLLEDIGQEYSGQAGNNAVTLTDWVMLAGGSADPFTAISSFLVKKTFSSKAVQSAIAKALNRGNPIKGDVVAEFEASQVKGLPSPTSNKRSEVGSGRPILVAPKGRKIEIVNQLP